MARPTRLCAYVDAGVPVNLTNGKGDTLLMPAAYHGHAGTVRALVARGADPAEGTPSALDTARVFGHTEFMAWVTAET